MRPPAGVCSPRRRGIALIEAMVAMLLLSMCALAYAALQLKGMTANSGALWRSKAVFLANEMADRMRANHTGLTANAYALLVTPTKVTDCGTAQACTPTRMALLDHGQWSATLGRELPAGTGAVCLDSTPDDGSATAAACDGAGTMYAVKLFWSERGEPARLVLPVRP